jgi:hypothetical protein
MRNILIFRFGRGIEVSLIARQPQVDQVEVPAMIYVANKAGIERLR